MELNSLDMIGFKSFCNKTELKFGAGVTAIIGPNGCGKSNVSEAIRWVLGEQNARNLRSDKMEDIIFAGTKTRPPTGMAEVSITFTNSRGILPLEYAEITLTRRLFRSGESEYQINRKPCRLKDIVDLFLDTGMGTHAYSLLERSMVDSILSDRTEDRRYLFDEASGIMKYKARRKTTLKKLVATENDLLRLEDIVSEVEKQVNSLKRQVKRAETYQRYAQDLVDTETALAYGKFHQLLNEEEPLGQQQQTLQQKRESLGFSIETREAEIETLRNQMLQQEQKVIESQKVLNRISQETKKLDEELLVNRERQSALENQILRANQDADNLQKRLKRLETEKVELEQLCLASCEEIAKLKENYEAVEQERNLASEKTKAHEANIAKIEEQTRTILRQRLSLENDLKNMKQRSQELEAQFKRSEQQLITMNEEKQAKKTELDHLNEDLTEIKTAIDTLEKQIQQRTEDVASKASERQQILQQEQADREKLASVQSNLKVLEQLQNRFEGYEKGVRSLMARKEPLPGLSGVLADSITTKPEYETAIELALGQNVQLIIAEDMDRARTAIETLVSEKSGRASFFPTDLMPHVSNVNRADFPLDKPGVIGLAAELVETKDPLQPLVKALLAAVVLVETLETALTLHKDYPICQFVALDGTIVDANGIVTGGDSGQGQDGSLLTRKRQITSLSREKTTLEKRLQENQAKRHTLEQAINELNAEQSDDQDGLNRARQKQSTMERQIHALGYQLETLDQRESELSVVVEKQATERETLSEKIRQMDKTYQHVAEESKKAEKDLETARTQLSDLRQQVGQLTNKLNRAQIELISAEGKLEKYQSDLDRIAETRKDTEKAIVQHQKDGEHGQDQLKGLKARQEELAVLIDEQHQKEEEQKRAVDEVRDVLHEQTVQVQETEKLVKQIRREREDIQQKIHEIELRLTQLKQERQDVVVRLRDEHQIDVAEIEEAPERLAEWRLEDGSLDFEKGETEAHDLRQRIRNLGPVNLMALDEYQKESERYEFLIAQKKDLEEAQASLKKALNQINKQARERFRETFEHIRIHFINTFTTLFEGGEADLMLEKNVDLLEAGIEIVAKPKGKKLQNINLLSAGERAMTAIALLFAIYLVKPSPFCILDEIDAPLDDANIGRFTKILRQLTEHSQFVMITHNKRTMEIADRLYGVTMEEPGVSRLVSVKFEE